MSKSKNRCGGQPGHPGHTLGVVESPNQFEVHGVTECEQCHTPLTTVEAQGLPAKLNIVQSLAVGL